jgi:hypothetical protein
MSFFGPLARDGRALQLSQLVLLLLVSFSVAAAFAPPGADVRKPIAAGLLVLLVVGPGVLIVLVFVGQHQYFPIENRYGYSLLPGAFAIAGSYWNSWMRLAAVSLLFAPYLAGCVLALLT